MSPILYELILFNFGPNGIYSDHSEKVTTKRKKPKNLKEKLKNKTSNSQKNKDKEESKPLLISTNNLGSGGEKQISKRLAVKMKFKHIEDNGILNILNISFIVEVERRVITNYESSKLGDDYVYYVLKMVKIEN